LSSTEASVEHDPASVFMSRFAVPAVSPDVLYKTVDVRRVLAPFAAREYPWTIKYGITPDYLGERIAGINIFTVSETPIPAPSLHFTVGAFSCVI
jgi:hypothetical protein